MEEDVVLRLRPAQLAFAQGAEFHKQLAMLVGEIRGAIAQRPRTRAELGAG